MPKSNNRRKNGKKGKKWKAPTGRTKNYIPRVSNKLSPHTGNFLVMMDDFIFDSAMKRTDAVAQSQLLIEAIKNNPLPDYPSEKDFSRWCIEFGGDIPTNDSIGFVLKDGVFSPEVMEGAMLDDLTQGELGEAKRLLGL